MGGPPSSIAPRKFMQEMIPSGTREMYGLGTFNLGFTTGHRDEYGKAYGHLGATYGYQSLAGFFPAINASMSIATNIETDHQSQPMDAFCDAYNAVVGLLLNTSFTCKFESTGYFGGCKCTSEDAIVV